MRGVVYPSLFCESVETMVVAVPVVNVMGLARCPLALHVCSE